ncbi:MAG: hypothetical protein HYU75_00370 [Betaproteobacteria bacterium]|nr:hypothetical protein [Betaproteobacteria bacterium]
MIIARIMGNQSSLLQRQIEPALLDRLDLYASAAAALVVVRVLGVGVPGAPSRVGGS